MPTIKDIARLSGVSYQTVSCVFSNGRKVSPKTVKKVLDAAAALNYTPNALARGLVNKKGINSIGIVFPYSAHILGHHYLGPLADAIIATATERKQSVTIFVATSASPKPEDVLIYNDGRCDGILVVGQPNDSPFVLAMAQSPRPFVCVNECWDTSVAPFVDADQVSAARSVAQHLISLGHRRIAVLSGYDQNVHVQQRNEGCARAFASADMSTVEGRFWPGDYSDSSVDARISKIFEPSDRPNWPTAIIGHNDFIALRAMERLEALGVRCPRDVSIVGIDDIKQASESSPRLTTVNLRFAECGSVATEMLLRLINNDTLETTQVRLPCNLVVRESTGPPA